MKLAGKPVAKIVRNSPVEGLEELNEVTIHSKDLLTDASSTYLVYLSLRNGVRFGGYSESCQLGQYFTLNINDKVTRLYTNVWCMRKENIKFI
jgi:hypothetical protein